MSEVTKVIAALNKKFGDGYIGVAKDILDKEYKRRSTGIFSLDLGLGGGLPERKIMMLAGPESSGKTSTMLSIIAKCQSLGGTAALIDIEHNFDPIYASKFGVKIKDLIIAQSNTIEQAGDTAEALIMSGGVDLLTLDSIAGAMSEKELEDSVSQDSMGGNAKAIGRLMKKVTARLNDIKNPVNTSFVIINQLREKVGLVFGSPNYTPGGRILHHLSDIIVWLRADSDLIGGRENPVGIKINYRTTKNRTFPPFRTGNYDLLFNNGFDNKRSIIEKAFEWGIIKKGGAWITYKEKQYQGVNKFISSLSDLEISEIEKEILKLKDAPPIVVKEDTSTEIYNDV